MAIQMRQDPVLEVNRVKQVTDHSLVDREQILFDAYYERAEILLSAFNNSLSWKNFSSKAEIFEEFRKFFWESQFQIAEVTKQLLDPDLKEYINFIDFEWLQKEFEKVLTLSIKEWDDWGVKYYYIDDNKLFDILYNTFEEYLSPEKKKPRKWVKKDIRSDYWKNIVDRSIHTSLEWFKWFLKDKAKTLWWNKVVFDRLKKLKWFGVAIPVLAGTAMSTIMTWGLVKFLFVKADIAWYTSPELFQDWVSYTLWAIAWVTIASAWVKAWKIAEEASLLLDKWLPVRQARTRLYKYIAAASVASTVLMTLDYGWIMVKAWQWMDAAKQVEYISKRVNDVMSFSPDKLDPNSPFELQRAHSMYAVRSAQTKKWIQSNIETEKASWAWPATMAHTYPLDWREKSDNWIKNAPWNNQAIRDELALNLATFDSQTRVNLDWKFWEVSWLYPWMKATLADYGQSIESSLKDIQIERDNVLKSIDEYRNSSAFMKFVNEVALWKTIDLDLRDVDNYQWAVVARINDLQYDLNKFNRITWEAIEAYNRYTSSVNDIRSRHYNAPPLSLTNIWFENVSLDWIKKVASEEIPKLKKTSTLEYVFNLWEVIWDQEMADSIQSIAKWRIAANVFCLIWPILVTMWVPAIRRRYNKSKGVKWNQRYLDQEKEFDLMMEKNIDLLVDALAPLSHIFPWYKPLSRWEVEAIFVDFLRDEYKGARTLTKHWETTLEKFSIWARNFFNSFVLHDTRTEETREKIWLNKALIAIRNDKNRKLKKWEKPLDISSLDSSSLPIKIDKMTEESLNRLFRKLIPEWLYKDWGLEIYQLLESLFTAREWYTRIVEDRQLEIDLRDKEVLESRFTKSNDKYLEIKQEITTFLWNDIRDFFLNEGDDKNILALFQEINELIWSIEEWSYFKTHMIEELEWKVNKLVNSWELYKQTDEYSNILWDKLAG